MRALAAVVAAVEHLAELSPIDDVRGTAAYRQDAALTLVRERCSRAPMRRLGRHGMSRDRHRSASTLNGAPVAVDAPADRRLCRCLARRIWA